MDQPVAATPELHYQPGAPAIRRKHKRRALFALIFLATVGVLWALGPAFFEQVRYVYWQHRCMGYTAPATLVAYEEDPYRASALAAKPGYQFPQGPYVGPSGFIAAGYVPAPLAHLSPEWNCMAFVHERTSPSGRHRLTLLNVRLSVQNNLRNTSRVIELFGSGKTSATMLPGSSLDGLSVGRLCIVVQPDDHLRLFWGQVDPDHPDHFTIRYMLNDQPGTIDGYLKDDDQLDLRVRDGPAMKIATTHPW